MLEAHLCSCIPLVTPEGQGIRASSGKLEPAFRRTSSTSQLMKTRGCSCSRLSGPIVFRKDDSDSSLGGGKRTDAETPAGRGAAGHPVNSRSLMSRFSQPAASSSLARSGPVSNSQAAAAGVSWALALACASTQTDCGDRADCVATPGKGSDQLKYRFHFSILACT